MKTVTALILLALATTAFGQSAADMVETSGVKGGLVVYIGSSDGSPVSKVLAEDSFIFHHLCGDPVDTAKARKNITKQGLYGRASAEHFPQSYLPYTDTAGFCSPPDIFVIDGLV